MRCNKDPASGRKDAAEYYRCPPLLAEFDLSFQQAAVTSNASANNCAER